MHLRCGGLDCGQGPGDGEVGGGQSQKDLTMD